MNDIQIFRNEQFGEVRTFTESDGKVTFCAADVATALGYSDTAKAIKQHCKEDGWAFHPVIDSMGRTQQAKFITKGNLIRLAASSKLPGADKFESWIFDEVIPSVMEHGAYATPETLNKMISSPEFGIKLLTALKSEQDKRKALETQIEQQRVQVLFARSVSTSDSSILIGQLAKMIKQNGRNIGQNRLFAWMRENGYLIRQKGSNYNLPTQKAMDMGLFRIKESTHLNGDGVNVTTKTTKVTGKGQQYFINKFLGDSQKPVSLAAVG